MSDRGIFYTEQENVNLKYNPKFCFISLLTKNIFGYFKINF